MLHLLLIIQIATALITAPAQGEVIARTVNILGTASHPQFERYEIAFAYDPNPTDTWFELQPPSTNSVTTGILAIWDTTRITDGTYMLRLRVYATDSNTPLETIVRNIKVRNTPPTETLTPAATLSPSATATLALLGPTATHLPLPTETPSGLLPTPTQLPEAAALDFSPYTSAFCNGVYLAGGVFLLLGLYALLRDRIRRPIRRWLRRIISDSRKP